MVDGEDAVGAGRGRAEVVVAAAGEEGTTTGAEVMVAAGEEGTATGAEEGGAAAGEGGCQTGVGGG